MTVLSQHEVNELYDKVMTMAAAWVERTKGESEDAAPTREQMEWDANHIRPLLEKYPDYRNWILSVPLWLEEKQQPSAPATNEHCQHPFEPKPVIRHHLRAARHKPFDLSNIGSESDRPGDYTKDQVQSVRTNSTNNQILKIMLTRGTDDQVFAAAKEIGMIPRDTPETPENAEKVKTVIATLNWLHDAYTPNHERKDPLQCLRHAREYILYGQAEGDSTALLGSTIDGHEVVEGQVGKGNYELNAKIEKAIAAFVEDSGVRLAYDPTSNGLVALYAKHFGQLYKEYPGFPRYIFSRVQSLVATQLPGWAVLAMTTWTVGPITDFGSPFVTKTDPEASVDLAARYEAKLKDGQR